MIKYGFALLLFFPFSLTVMAQEETDPILSVGFSLIPEVTWLNNATTLVGELEYEDGKPGYSAQINVGYAFNEFLTFQSGVGFGKRYYDYKVTGLIFGSDIDPNLGIVSESRFEAQVSISEIQVPLMLRISPKENWFLSAGLELAFQNENNSNSNYFHGDGTVVKASPVDPKLNFAPVLGFGYQAPLSDHLSLSVQPQIKYYLRDFVLTNSNLISVGLRTSLDIGW